MKKNNFLAINLMIIHAFAGASLFVLMKFISKSLSSNQTVFLYKSFLLILLMPWFLYQGGLNNLKTKKFNIYLLGSIFGTSATLCLMHALHHVPVANATILGYLEKILLISIGVGYYKEKITTKMVIAIIACVAAAISIVIPKINNQFEFNIYYLYVFLSIFLWVAYCLTIKYLGEQDNIKCQTFYNTLLSSIFSFLVLFYFKQMDKPILDYNKIIKIIDLIILVSFMYMVVLLSLIKSLREGDLSIITPFGYSKPVFAAILAFFVFNEIPTKVQIFAYLVIIFSSWYLATQVARNKRLVSLSLDGKN